MGLRRVQAALPAALAGWVVQRLRNRDRSHASDLYIKKTFAGAYPHLRGATADPVFRSAVRERSDHPALIVTPDCKEERNVPPHLGLSETQVYIKKTFAGVYPYLPVAPEMSARSMTTNQSTIALCLILIGLLAQPALGNDRAAEKPLPTIPSPETGQTVNGLAWTLSLARDFTTLDALVIDAQLLNASKKQLIFDTGPKMGKPKLILTPKGKDPIVAVMDGREGVRNPAGNYKPKPGEKAQGFKIDLRLFFGKLPAGEYAIQTIYSKDGYVIKGDAPYKPSDIASPVMHFTIRDTTLKAAQASMPKPGDLVFQTDEPVAIDPDAQRVVKLVRTATLTNKGDKPIVFPAYLWDQPKGQPLSVTATWQRWNPEQGWFQDEVLGFCGTGLGRYTLKPNASVQIMINGALSDGVHRYTLHYSADPEFKQWQTVHSNAIQTELFADTYLAEKDPKDKAAKGDAGAAE